MPVKARSMRMLLGPFRSHVTSAQKITPKNLSSWLAKQPRTESGEVDYRSMLDCFVGSLTQEEAQGIVYLLGMIRK